MILLSKPFSLPMEEAFLKLLLIYCFFIMSNCNGYYFVSLPLANGLTDAIKYFFFSSEVQLVHQGAAINHFISVI